MTHRSGEDSPEAVDTAVVAVSANRSTRVANVSPRAERDLSRGQTFYQSFVVPNSDKVAPVVEDPVARKINIKMGPGNHQKLTV